MPQGVPADPSYLPTPHEVIETGWKMLTTSPRNLGPKMGQRYRISLGIIFSGFLWVCLFGVPIGILCGTYGFFSTLLEPFTDFFRFIPTPICSTLLVAVPAAGDSTKIAFHMEDMEVCAATQRGMRSDGYGQGRLSHLEEPIWHFQKYLAEIIRRAGA